jgi:hypothetical protein
LGLHSGTYGVNMEFNSKTFEEWVKREGVRVGVKYGLASKWTSFLAVKKREARTWIAGLVGSEEAKSFEMKVEGFWTN